MTKAPLLLRLPLVHAPDAGVSLHPLLLFQHLFHTVMPRLQKIDTDPIGQLFLCWLLPKYLADRRDTPQRDFLTQHGDPHPLECLSSISSGKNVKLICSFLSRVQNVHIFEDDVARVRAVEIRLMRVGQCF